MYPIIDFGNFQLPTFFLVLSLLMGLVFYLTTQRSRKLRIDEKAALDLSLVLTLAAIVGARLAHVAFENPDYYWDRPIKILFFWEGGFVFYGGFFLSFASGFLFLFLKKKLEYLNLYMQLFTPILSVSYALGRLGCFLEGCCYGKFCFLPWAVSGRHPTQIYSSLWEIAVLILLLNYEAKKETVIQKNPERLFYIWLFFHSIGRGLIEYLRDDFRGDWPLVSISTWVSILLFLVAISYFYRHRKVKA
jgi:phosphatidylglycerol:prolipoprotein diacylglycerol transferase